MRLQAVCRWNESLQCPRRSVFGSRPPVYDARPVHTIHDHGQPPIPRCLAGERIIPLITRIFPTRDHLRVAAPAERGFKGETFSLTAFIASSLIIVSINRAARIASALPAESGESSLSIYQIRIDELWAASASLGKNSLAKVRLAGPVRPGDDDDGLILVHAVMLARISFHQLHFLFRQAIQRVHLGGRFLAVRRRYLGVQLRRHLRVLLRPPLSAPTPTCAPPARPSGRASPRRRASRSQSGGWGVSEARRIRISGECFVPAVVARPEIEGHHAGVQKPEQIKRFCGML